MQRLFFLLWFFDEFIDPLRRQRANICPANTRYRPIRSSSLLHSSHMAHRSVGRERAALSVPMIAVNGAMMTSSYPTILFPTLRFLERSWTLIWSGTTGNRC
jgi:hypothetical protein